MRTTLPSNEFAALKERVALAKKSQYGRFKKVCESDRDRVKYQREDQVNKAGITIKQAKKQIKIK